MTITTSQSKFLTALLQQNGLTENDLPENLATLEKEFASQLIDSLKQGHYGFPPPAPVSADQFRIIFLYHAAINDGFNPQFSTAMQRWNRANRDHAATARRWWKQNEPGKTPGQPWRERIAFVREHLNAFGTPRQLRQRLWSAVLSPDAR